MTKISTSTVAPLSKEANQHLSEYDYDRLVDAFVYQINIAQIVSDLNLPELTV